MLLLSLSLPVNVVACSCFGTQSIGDAFYNSEAVVVGRVIRHEPPNYKLYPLSADVVQVQVVESLRGKAAGQILVSSDVMCYRSFDVRDFEPGHTYVFALETFATANASGSYSSHESPHDPIPREMTDRLYLIPGCSHTALAVRDDGLYTNELTETGGRRLDYYLPLWLVRILFPLRLLSFWRILAWVAIILAILAGMDIARRVRHGRQLRHSDRS